MVNLINDLSQLTTIPTKALTKLSQKSLICINNALAESIAAGENETCVDIGIGNLYIVVDGNSIKYGFEPHKPLINSTTNTVKNKRNLLVDTLESTLVSRVTNTYKDLI